MHQFNAIPILPKIAILGGEASISFCTERTFSSVSKIWQNTVFAAGMGNDNDPKIEIRFKNAMSHPVTVCDQSNVAMVVEPDPLNHRRVERFGFYMVKSYYLMVRNVGATLARCSAIIEGLGGSVGSPELLSMFRYLKSLDAGKTSVFGMIRLDVEFVLLPAQFEAGAFYDQRTNLVMGRCSPLELPIHPLSAEFIDVHAPTMDNASVLGAHTLAKIVYVNNSPMASPKFVNMLGTVYKLIPRSDLPRLATMGVGAKGEPKELNEYVQVFESTQREDEHGKIGVGHHIYTMEQARAKFGIYNCASDAETLGVPEKIAETALRETKERLQQTIHRHEEEKLARDRMDAQRRAEFAEAQRQAELEHTGRMNDLKTQHERALASRRDWSDFLKFISGAILTVGTIIVTLLKFMPAPSSKPALMALVRKMIA